MIQATTPRYPVTVADTAYHTVAVKTRPADRAFIIADMPSSAVIRNRPNRPFRNAVTLMAAGAQMVAPGGGGDMAKPSTSSTGASPSVATSA